MASVDLDGLDKVIKNLTDFVEANKQTIPVATIHNFMNATGQMRTLYQNLLNECKTLLHTDLVEIKKSGKQNNDNCELIKSHILDLKDRLNRSENDNKGFQEEVRTALQHLKDKLCTKDSQENVVEDSVDEVSESNDNTEKSKEMDGGAVELNDKVEDIPNENTKTSKSGGRKKKNINMTTKNI